MYYHPTRRYHRIDAWRGYAIPKCSVVGASDTGSWSDSPCPSDEVKAELRRFCKVLRDAGIRYRTRFGSSSNVFCAKRWIVVSPNDFDRAANLVEIANPGGTGWSFIHDADLDKCARPV